MLDSFNDDTDYPVCDRCDCCTDEIREAVYKDGTYEVLCPDCYYEWENELERRADRLEKAWHMGQKL